MKNKKDNKKIDLVYAWVDGYDPEWNNKKNFYLKKYNSATDETAISDNKYRDNDELKYSLRSVEMYAPWVNNIFIITDNQIPEWLNIDNPKITIIDHKDIMPDDALPTFNSIAIETCIPNIPDLSEYFLYANDDMFFMDDATPDFFYAKDGYPICRFKRKLNGNNVLYKKLIKNSQELIKKRFNKDFTIIPHHSIDAYRKSTVLECLNTFPEITRNNLSKFREDTNYERILFLYYAILTKKGHKKIVSRIDSSLPLIKKMINFCFKIYKKDTVLVQNNNLHFEDTLKLFKPTLACINDRKDATDESMRKIKDFLERSFPNESSFEK